VTARPNGLKCGGASARAGAADTLIEALGEMTESVYSRSLAPASS
jgi:hypothetical protein